MISAVMASQFILSLMVGHRHITLDATRRFAALHALYLRSIAAAVLKQNDLFLVFQALTDTVHQGITEMPVHLLAFVLTFEVNQTYIR